jgi:hypothetical protein
MIDTIRVALAGICLVGLAAAADAQTASSPADDGWHVAVYPVLVSVPVSIGIDVDVPPSDGEGGESGEIIDSRFDGAFFGGFNVSNGVWRVEGYGIWAAFGGDRPERPFLAVDVDVVYGDVRLGRRIAPDLFVTGGVRRIAFKYDIQIADLPNLSRKPGLWDPLVGIGWHREGPKLEWHAAFEGGGFGVGAEVDLGAVVRVDWKPVRHFGLAAGYNFLYLKVEDTVLRRTVVVEPMVHGPMVGFGVYF